MFYTKNGLLAVSVRDGAMAMAPYHKLARKPCGFTRSGREDGGGVGTGYPGTKRFAIASNRPRVAQVPWGGREPQEEVRE